MSQCHDGYQDAGLAEFPDVSRPEESPARAPAMIRIEWHEHDGKTSADAMLVDHGLVVTAHDEGLYHVNDDKAARLAAGRALEALGRQLVGEVEADYA